MDKKQFEEIEERLLKLNKVVEKLDSSIRVAAFEFLKPYITGGTIAVPKDKHEKQEDSPASGGADDLAELIEKHPSDRPSHNAKLLSAYWFSQYGSAPFSTKWIKDTAGSSGLTVPEAVDMTFRQAQSKGKGVYEALGKRGLIKPTIAGETYLKQTFGVRKGTKAAPAVDE